jgi:hypothetical protein
MFTQTDTTFTVVSQKTQDVINVSRRHHWRFRLITDFQGVIDRPVYNSAGDWLYMPMRDEDRPIIPKAAFIRHHAVIKAGIRVAQVVIGHEIKVAPEATGEILAPAPARTSQVDWLNVAEVAGKGLLIGMMGLAMVSFSALTGALSLVDPSYCITIFDDDGNPGSVIELIRWNTEVKHGTATFIG